MVRRRDLALLLVTLAATFAGCGDGDDSSGDSGDVDPAPVTMTPDDGCTEDYPERMANSGPLAEQFVTCADDVGSLRLHNVSSAVLVVGDYGSGATLTASDAASGSFLDEMVAQTTPATCSGTTCSMPPSAGVYADGPSARVVVSVDVGATAVANMARAVSGWAYSKLQGRAGRFAASIRGCANGVADASQGYTYLDDAMRSVLETGVACRSLYRDVAAELREAPPAVSTASDDVLRIGNRLGAKLKLDLTVFAGVRAITRLP